MKVIDKLCKVIVAVAVLIAPVASGYCRTFFYEENEPEGMDDFVSWCKKNKNSINIMI